MNIFAKLDSNNLVISLIPLEDYVSSTEQDGVSFCQSVYEDNALYIQTYPDGSKRNKMADIGDYYDLPTDAFYVANITQNNLNPSRWANLPNNTSYCVNYRASSSTFTGLIVSTYFNRPAQTFSAANLRGIPTTATPTGTPYVIVRDPIDRFISAYALRTSGVPAWLPVDQFIDWLVQQDKTKLNAHFIPQVNLIGIPAPSGIQYFDFAKDLTPLAIALGLPTPLPVVNVTDISKKPVLTADQISTLQTFYSDDTELYNSILKT